MLGKLIPFRIKWSNYVAYIMRHANDLQPRSPLMDKWYQNRMPQDIADVIVVYKCLMLQKLQDDQ